ncbi:MAG: energy-coupling factor ABC transporter ATP-binding protein [Candidatus Delongbacteria bacterium]|nr:energy-coupling factor ABC transporter ATP-binding protein [Candidatus Delongbacteria bacterium]
MIKVTDLSFSISGKEILNNVNFSVDDNTSLIISGPSGAGKTKLLEIISGFERSYTGKVSIGGSPLENLGDDLYDMISYVSNSWLENTLSEKVMSDLVFPLELKNLPEHVIKEKLDRIISVFNLEDLIDVPPMNLSGGEKQFVNICTMIIKEPKILMIDDQMTMIDRGKREIIFKEIIRSKKHTAVVISKDTNIYSEFDKILFLDKGSVYYFGDTVTFNKEHRSKLIDTGLIEK